MERLTIGVEFGGVSIGDTTARLGCKINRDRMQLETADKLFAGRLLSGVVDLESGSAPGQHRLPGMEDAGTEIQGSFQVKQFSVNAKQIGLGLTFGIEDVDVATLALFAKRTGRLTIADVSDLETVEHTHPDVIRGENNPHTRGTPALAAVAKLRKQNHDAGAEMPLTELIKFGMTAKKIDLVESACGGSTIGKLEDWFRSEPLWNTKIKGMGEEWITKFQDAHFAFRRQYPIPSDEPEPEDEPAESEPQQVAEPSEPASLEERFIGVDLPAEWLPKLVECGINDAFDLVAVFADDNAGLRFAGRFVGRNLDALGHAAERWRESDYCSAGCRDAYADGCNARTDGKDDEDNPFAMLDPRFSHWSDGWNDAEPREIFDAETLDTAE